MDKVRISTLSKGIRNNALYLQSLYLTLSQYKYDIYKLYVRKGMCERDWEEDLFFEVDIYELQKKYNNFKEYVKKLEKEQKERKTLLKSLTKTR